MLDFCNGGGFVLEFQDRSQANGFRSGGAECNAFKEFAHFRNDSRSEHGMRPLVDAGRVFTAVPPLHRVVVMNHGVIEQIDTPDAVYNRPASAFVCDFLGNANKLDCTIVGGAVEIGGHRIENTAPPASDGRGVAFIRPHEFDIAAAGQPGVPVTLRRLTRTGPMAALDCLTESGALIEMTTIEPPTGLLPGAALTLVPRRVRAYSA